jgi:hypothetical protein
MGRLAPLDDRPQTTTKLLVIAPQWLDRLPPQRRE